MWKVLGISLVVAIGFVSAMVWIANSRFNQQTSDQIDRLLGQGESSGAPICEADLTHLPLPIRQWLTESGVLGQSIPRTVRLKQEGEIRLGPDKPWMPFRADQYYTIDPIAFLWRVSATAVPGVFIRGVDSLKEGYGRMQMRPLALFSVVNASGPTLDQGTALRYLQEIIWFPHAALSPAISWQAIDDKTAKATLTLDTVTVTGTFSFNDNGEVICFRAMRYRDEQTLQLWHTPMRDHERMAGSIVPTAGEGMWGSGDEAFTYIRLRILSIEYDAGSVYP